MTSPPATGADGLMVSALARINVIRLGAVGREARELLPLVVQPCIPRSFRLEMHDQITNKSAKVEAAMVSSRIPNKLTSRTITRAMDAILTTLNASLLAVGACVFICFLSM